MAATNSILLSTTTNNTNVCSTSECIKTANSISADIDLNVDPCSDFYQYTCKLSTFFHYSLPPNFLTIRCYRWKLVEKSYYC